MDERHSEMSISHPAESTQVPTSAKVFLPFPAFHENRSEYHISARNEIVKEGFGSRCRSDEVRERGRIISEERVYELLVQSVLMLIRTHALILQTKQETHSELHKVASEEPMHPLRLDDRDSSSVRESGASNSERVRLPVVDGR